MTQKEPKKSFPENLQKVLDAHGGLDKWNSFAALTFGIEKDFGTEINHVNLWDRRDYIKGENFEMGFDGKNIWLKADTSYKGNAIFYHNLMFYFYAMPFLLADDGINYSEDKPLEFEGKSYPAIHITYDKGVGASDLDEYILYYDPETYQMAWLGYTATYFSKERKKQFNKIRYDDWVNVEGVLLPQSISWYKVEEDKVTEPRNKVVFSELALMKDAHRDGTFAMPEGGEVVVVDD